MNKNNAKVIPIAHILWCMLKISLQWLIPIHFKIWALAFNESCLN